jgi:hypothetical protein
MLIHLFALLSGTDWICLFIWFIYTYIPDCLLVILYVYLLSCLFSSLILYCHYVQVENLDLVENLDNILLTYSIISLQYTHALHSGHSVPPQSDSHSKEKLKIIADKTFPSLSPLWLFFGYLAALFQLYRLYSIMTHCEFEMYHVHFYLCGLKINLLGDNVNTIKSNSSILFTD